MYYNNIIMRIAVLIYGRLNKCVEHYNNIMNSIGADNDIHFFLSSDNSPQSQLDDFINIYKHVKYINDKIVHNCDVTKYPGIFVETNIPNMICHFINKSRVFSLLETYVQEENIYYDVVMSLRVDLVFNGKFIFNTIEDNTLYIPNDYDWLGINDQVAYGNIEAMKKYANLFNNMMDLLERRISVPHPESLNLANINFYKLNTIRVELPYYIER